MANFLSNKSIDFLTINGTWLKNSFMNSVLAIHVYEIVRSDSPSQLRKHGMAVVTCDVANVLIIHLFELGVYTVNVYMTQSYNNYGKIKLISLMNIFFCQ